MLSIKLETNMSFLKAEGLCLILFSAPSSEHHVQESSLQCSVLNECSPAGEQGVSSLLLVECLLVLCPLQIQIQDRRIITVVKWLFPILFGKFLIFVLIENIIWFRIPFSWIVLAFPFIENTGDNVSVKSLNPGSTSYWMGEVLHIGSTTVGHRRARLMWSGQGKGQYLAEEISNAQERHTGRWAEVTHLHTPSLGPDSSV